MVIAVGLSGVFVVLLSGMLGQTLALSTASQNQIIAGSIADQVVEQLQHHGCIMSDTLGMPLSNNLHINPDLQLDMVKNSFGTFTKDGLYDQSIRWTDGNGNYFRGDVTIQPFPASVPTVDTTFNVSVDFPSENGGTKSVKRITTYFVNGAKFQ